VAYDPFAPLGQIAMRATPRAAALPAFTPQEEDSWLGYFAGSGLSALEAIGNVLDTPGSMVRAGLVGENPFSGVFDTRQRVSGRDVLQEWGMLGRNRPGLDLGDVAGFAAEVAFDPTTYLTFGTSAALKPAGQVAKALGKLPKRSVLNPITGAVEDGVRAMRMAPGGLNKILAESPELLPDAKIAASAMGYDLDAILAEASPLASQVGFGAPFMNPVATANLPYGDKLAKGLDTLGAVVRTSKPGTTASRLFDAGARGASTWQVQEAARPVSDVLPGARADLLTEEGLNYYKVKETLPELMTPEGNYDHEKLWDLIEGRDRRFRAQPKPLSVDESISRVFPKIAPEKRQFAKEFVTDLRASQESKRLRQMELGLEAPNYEDKAFTGTKYAHRTPTDPDYIRTGGRSAEALVTDDPFGQRKIHAPTSLVNDVLADEQLHKLMKELEPQSILKEATEGQVEKLTDEFLYLDTDDLTFLQAKEMIRQGDVGADIDRAVWLKPAPPYLRQNVVDQAMTHFGWGPTEKKYFADLKKIRQQAELGEPDAMAEWTDIAAANLEGMEFQVKQGKMLARMNLLRDEELVAAGADFFGHDALRDYTRKSLADVERIAYTEKMHDLFAGIAEAGDPVLKMPGKVKLHEAFKGMGVGTKPETQSFAVRAIAKSLHKAGKLTDQQLARITDQHALVEDGLAVLAGFDVPEAVATDAASFMSLMRAPDEASGILGFYDKFLNNYKANVTAAFPSFHGRNAVSLFWQNLIAGGRDPRYAPLDPRSYSQPFVDIHNLLQGKPIKDAHTLPMFAGQNLTPTQATNQLRAILAGHGVAMGPGNATTEATELLGARGTRMASGDIADRLPGQTPLNPAVEIGKGIRDFFTKRGAQNPLRTAGGPLGDETDRFAPVAAGRKVATYLEDTGRGATMLAKLRQGYSPEAAAAISQAAHVDYRSFKFAPFEQQVMKRLVPFYSFSRGAIPYALRDLMQRPGGINAQAVRVMNMGRDDDGFLPPQLEGGMAVPLGPENDEGMQRYLARIDLPVESLNDLVRFEGGVGKSISETMKNVIAQSSPIVKTPVELAFGQSAFQGRNLDRLDPLVGRIASNLTGGEQPYAVPGSTTLDALIMASPFSRYATTARQLTDSRKGPGAKAVNLLTGARLTDVDMNKSRMFAAQDAIEQILLANPNARQFTNVYVPADKRELLSPEEALALQLYQVIGTRFRERAKQP
jgi:hypothetical protein